jgi:hypothetical protein
MKQADNVQYFVESNNALSVNSISPGKDHEPFFLLERYNSGKTEQVQGRSNDFYDLNPGAQIFNQGTKLFPVKKTSSVATALKPVFTDYLKETASHLSDVEMALECYNVTYLQSSTKALKELFFEMKMPAVYQLAEQMEELAREYELEEVKSLLRAIKKIIGQSVKQRNQPGG